MTDKGKCIRSKFWFLSLTFSLFSVLFFLFFNPSSLFFSWLPLLYILASTYLSTGWRLSKFTGQVIIILLSLNSFLPNLLASHYFPFPVGLVYIGYFSISIMLVKESGINFNRTDPLFLVHCLWSTLMSNQMRDRDLTDGTPNSESVFKATTLAR